MSFAWRAYLVDPSSYARALARLLSRRDDQQRLLPLTPGGLSLIELGQGSAAFESALARDVARGAWRSGPYRRVDIVTAGKERTLHLPGAIDHVVSGVVADLLTLAAAPRVRPCLWSYRSGLSAHDAVRAFATVLRRHTKTTPVHERGLFVMKRDVASYADSVPLASWSPLWPAIASLLGPGAREDPLWRVIVDVIRPTIVDGGEHQKVVGLPLGAPVNAAIFNLYLLDLDDAMSGIEGLFYARYGDDVLMAHADASEAARAARRVDEVLASLWLSASAKKSVDVFLNNAGRAALPWAGAQDIEYLGFAVCADGAIALRRRHVRRVLRDIDHRVRAVTRVLRSHDREVVGAAACAAVRDAVDDRSALAMADARRLARAVTDRRQLAWLDRKIAEIVARAVTGVDHASALRTISWQHMRADWGLPSLVRRRNSVPEGAT